MLTRDPIVGLCLVALAAAAGWALLVTACVLLEVWRARRAGRRAGLRRVVLLCCGIAIAAPAPGALADDAGIAGLPLPDRAVGPAHARPTDRPSDRAPDQATGRTVVVSPGDCLWTIAAADLPRDAGLAEITARWQAIYRVNRALIGADPSLVHPGQRLVLPR